ncbi:MAG: tRNA 2-thiouridine(34) synthase MnmA [Firmicutes bacterium]|nr:tRNA 2-thiouridine(34) synthase MnmA [Bacillota bacterium]
MTDMNNAKNDNAPKKRVLIAMSGGVDSSAAARVLIDQGLECEGVTMRLYRDESITDNGKSCCSDRDEDDAAFVCHQLGIPHESLCCTKEFRSCVIQKFIDEYQAGRTPNPCVDCNRFMKFGLLMDYAREKGFDAVATGHYARVERNEETGRWQLLKAVNESKDQSYVLYMLTQEQLSHVILPLGGRTKDETRAIAEDAGLINARKRESQDICFVPDGDYAAFLMRWAGIRAEEGDILDEKGNAVGRHKGAVRYTTGQRKGLGFAAGEPVYVTGKDMKANTVTIGPESSLFHNGLEASGVNWVSVAEPEGPIRVTARTRYHQKEKAALCIPLPGGGIKVIFDEPQRAITPGQAVVLYDGDLLVCGGTIERVFDE